MTPTRSPVPGNPRTKERRILASRRTVRRSVVLGSQVAGLALVVVLVVAGKHFYRAASAEDLRWLLAPTARMVSMVTGTNFVAEAGVGWIDRSVTFEIAPVCAGLNFLLAAFLALALGGLAAMTTWRAMAVRVAAAVGIAYVATLVVNTIRIAIAIRMHQRELGGADGGELHRIEGIVVYLGGLCVLYAGARKLSERTRRAVVP